MNIDFIETGQVLTIKLKGELDHHSADEARVLIDEKIKNERYNKLVIDLKGLDFIDSSGICSNVTIILPPIYNFLFFIYI